jgi:3-hydroxyisobutyrate dehydrogenase-like beta-hydroxyacid dehydrogenase
LAEACTDVQLFLLSLPSSAALAEVTDDLSRYVKRGSIVIETSTLPIEDKERARQQLQGQGIHLLDCPISGTGTQAKTKDLVIYASGDRVAYRKALPLLAVFCREHHFIGAFGDGMKLKMIANMLVAIHTVAAAEALTLAKASGLNVRQVLGLLRAGAAASRMLDLRGTKMVAGDYRPMMRLELWQKDMAIISRFAATQNCPTLIFSACTQLFMAAMASGHADADASVVYEVLQSTAAL